VALCIQEQGGSATGCSLGQKGIPATVATKEVKSVNVTDGTIVLTLNDIGKSTDGKKITFTVANVVGEAVIWNTTTDMSGSDTTVLVDAITKNNAGT
jgi:type IV pilus assembly protein PilA